MNTIAAAFLGTVLKRFRSYKDLGDKTFSQLTEDDFHFQPNEASNSIAVIIQHLSGNMLSRWTDFLTSDGEKEWRNREEEFEVHPYNRQQLLQAWEQGWACLLEAVAALQEADLLTTIYIRGEGLTVIDAIGRQLSHYAYHVGQIVYLGRMIKDQQWKSLSIPKGDSQTYNQYMQNSTK